MSTGYVENAKREKVVNFKCCRKDADGETSIEHAKAPNGKRVSPVCDSAGALPSSSQALCHL